MVVEHGDIAGGDGLVRSENTRKNVGARHLGVNNGDIAWVNGEYTTVDSGNIAIGKVLVRGDNTRKTVGARKQLVNNGDIAWKMERTQRLIKAILPKEKI